MANTLARQDEVQSRSEVMRHLNACPIMNKDEHVEMPQRNVQQPQLNGPGFPAWSGAAWIQRSWITFTNGESQDFCFAAKGGWKTSVLYFSFPSSTASMKSGLFLPPMCRKRTGSRLLHQLMRSFYTKERNMQACRATWQALQTPIPPFDTGSKAWHYAITSSNNKMLRIDRRVVRMTSSNRIYFNLIKYKWYIYSLRWPPNKLSEFSLHIF